MDKYQAARDVIIKNIAVFEDVSLDRNKARTAICDIKSAARETHSLSVASRRMTVGVRKYFKIERKNRREIKRFLKQSRRRLLRKEKGKFASYEIKPAKITDVRQQRGELADILREALKLITQ